MAHSKTSTAQYDAPANADEILAEYDAAQEEIAEHLGPIAVKLRAQLGRAAYLGRSDNVQAMATLLSMAGLPEDPDAEGLTEEAYQPKGHKRFRNEPATFEEAQAFVEEAKTQLEHYEKRAAELDPKAS